VVWPVSPLEKVKNCTSSLSNETSTLCNSRDEIENILDCILKCVNFSDRSAAKEKLCKLFSMTL